MIFASIVTLSLKLVVPSTVKLSAIVTSEVVWPIVIGTAEVDVPNLIPFVVSVVSILTASVASTSSVVAPDILVAPVPAKDNCAIPSFNVKASVDVNASVPALFNTIPVAPASNSIAKAFTSTLVDASLPTVIVLADAPEPILIAPVTASSPRLMAPAEELSERAPALSISRPSVPSCFIITSSSRPRVILPLSEFNFKSWFILMSPLFPIIILCVPAVKNCNWSLSSLAAVSALIYVSWSTSITPPKEPQASPAP